ncbi:uncharacterized protein LOC110441480 [Mizuhopecten yessoensis]|uniref:Ependymin-related protein 1 n=1 Tax=Mizuhopecten yessoensis TaxID=6573 RepID=A0A210PJH6_MIZYE|nr:uncharacterized protein LOC110441480 [Mizuhopecten yessoensis]OWF36576.1 hypothetical protein KP79_PYT03098 [Mizuhopecten yessoensis]
MLALLLLCFAPLAVAEPITAKCCFPHKFTAVVMENGGLKMPNAPASGIDYVTHMYANFDKSLVRMDRNGTTGGLPDIQTMYFNYTKHMLHFIKDGQCTPTSLAAPVPSLCFREGYHYEGRHVLGSKGNNIISDKWSRTSTATNISMSLYVSEDCTPLIQIYTDLASAVRAQTILTYTSFSEGVSDDVFNLPDSCQS